MLWVLLGPFNRRSTDAGWSVLRPIFFLITLQLLFLYDDEG